MSVYLDHAATTDLRPEALAAWCAVHAEGAARTGNPSSLHASGRRARMLVEQAREQVADALHVRPTEVLFTSGGTEADNLAVKGLWWARKPGTDVILCSSVEHHAVLDVVAWLGRHEGAHVVWLPVDEVGRVAPSSLAAALARHDGRVALVTVMWANNEIGTVQPVAELAALCHAAGVPFHVDAVQAVGTLEVDAALPGITSLALSGHKFGASVGTGALVLRAGARCEPLTHGGGQEREVRSGTVDAAGAVALAAALEASLADAPSRVARLAGLRTALVDGVRALVPSAVVNGSPDLPGIAHLSFPGCEGDALLMLLDARGVQCSTGSACSAGVAEPSHVLVAMGQDPVTARSSLRFSLGRTSTAADVEAVLAAIVPAVERAAVAGQLRQRS